MIELAEVPVQVVAEARNGDDGLDRWRETRPDAVVLDFRLPGQSGLELAAQILAEDPDQPIILFSAFLDDQTIRRAEKVGVRDWVSKDEIRRLPDLLVEHGRQ